MRQKLYKPRLIMVRLKYIEFSSFDLVKSTSTSKLVWPHWAKQGQGERAFIVATWQLSLAFINIVSHVCSVHKRMPGLTN